MVYFRKHLLYVKYCETLYKNPVSGHPFYYQKYYHENTKSIFSNTVLHWK